MESSTSSLQKKNIRWNLLGRLMDNPMLIKEIKERMRGARAFAGITIYLSLISLMIGAIYFVQVEDNGFSGNPNALQQVGKTIFGAVVLLELLIIYFIGPALTSGAVSSERERQTFDLLRVSLLSWQSFILGKLYSAVMYLLLLIAAAIPLQSVAFFLGGVDIPEMIVSTLMLIASAFLFCMVGLYFSSIAKRTIVATVFSYAAVLLPVILLYLLFFLMDNNVIHVGFMNSEGQKMLNVILWTSFSVNPLAAALLSEFLLMDEHQLFFYEISGYNFSVIVLSPWILYLTFSFILTVSMIWLSTLYLNHYER